MKIDLLLCSWKTNTQIPFFFSVNHAPNTLQLWPYLGRFYQIASKVQLLFVVRSLLTCTWRKWETKKLAHLLGTRAQDLPNSIKTQYDFRVCLTEIPSWGSPSTYGDVVSAAATEVGAQELARGGERGLAKAPCLGPCIPCIPCNQAPCLGRRMLERCASTKYVHCTWICLIMPLSVLELEGFFHRPAHPSALDTESYNFVRWQLCGTGLCIEALVSDWSKGGTICTEFFFISIAFL